MITEPNYASEEVVQGTLETIALLESDLGFWTKKCYNEVKEALARGEKIEMYTIRQLQGLLGQDLKINQPGNLAS